MVGREYDDRVVTEVRSIQFVQHTTDLGVHVSDRRVVSLAKQTCLTCVDTIFERSHHFPIVVQRDRRHAEGRFGGIGRCDIDVIVHRPILRRGVERRVRFPHADGQKERSIAASQLFQPIDRGGGDPPVQVGVVGNIAAGGAGHRRVQFVRRNRSIDSRGVPSV